jgi:glycosyltransferase involved in cell wall biosynthesis
MLNNPPCFLYVGNHAGYFLTHRLPVMQAIRDAGYEVHVAAPAEADALEKMVVANAAETIRSLGFHYHPISIKRGSIGLAGELRVVSQLYRIYKRLKPDLVYHATIKPVLYGGILARMTGVPAVISAVTGLGYVFLANGFQATLLRVGVKTAYRLALGHPNMRVLFQNTDDCAAFIKQGLVKSETTAVIKGSGVDMQKFTATQEPDDMPIVVLPSRMLWDKGVGEFVEAAAILKRAGVSARFVLVGDTDPDNPTGILREQLQEWHDRGVIEWWGWRENMPEIFRTTHIVCLPSYREGIPKALIEAAASGRPIVTADVPGCREIVYEGENGFLVPVRDSHLLAAALRRLVENTNMRRQMGQRSREIAEVEFSVETIVAQTLAICEQVEPIHELTQRAK